MSYSTFTSYRSARTESETAFCFGDVPPRSPQSSIYADPRARGAAPAALRRVAEIEFPGDGGLCIEASSTVTGTVNCTRDEVENLNSISLLSEERQGLGPEDPGERSSAYEVQGSTIPLLHAVSAASDDDRKGHGVPEPVNVHLDLCAARRMKAPGKATTEPRG